MICTLEVIILTEQEFVSLVGSLAHEDMLQSGILASVTAAQACLESGYGTTVLATEAQNYFGMKTTLSNNDWKSVWDGVSKYTKVTDEQDPDGTVHSVTADFRKYPDMLTSIQDHSCYLNGAKNGSVLRYAGLSGQRDYRTAAQIIKNGGYATDIAYVDKLCNLIERWKLTQFDKMEDDAMAKLLIICGHGTNKNGSYDPGATSKWGEEATYTRELGTMIHQNIGTALDVTMYPQTQNCYSYSKAGQRPDYGAYDFVLEIHFNAKSKADPNGDGRFTGVGGYYHPNNAGRSIADTIVNNIAALGFKVWQNCTSTGLLNLNNAQAAGTKYFLLETAFIDDGDDMTWYNTNKGAVAQSVANTLITSLGGTIKPEWKGTGIKVCTENNLGVYRTSSGSSSDRVGTLQAGDLVEVDGTKEGGFAHIALPAIGLYGYADAAKLVDYVPWKGTGIVIADSDNLEILIQPSGTKVGVVQAGSMLETNGETKDGWTHVALPAAGTYGWVPSNRIYKWKATGIKKAVANDVCVRATPEGRYIGALDKGGMVEVDGTIKTVNGKKWYRIAMPAIKLYGYMKDNLTD